MMELSNARRTSKKEKMSFSVRFNAEDEEVEGLYSKPTLLRSTGSIEEYPRTPDQSLGSTQYLGLFGLKRSSSSDAEPSPCDTTIRRLDSFLSDIKEGLCKSDNIDLGMSTKKYDDSGQDDDSVSLISDEIEEIRDENEKISSSFVDTNWFSIRRRRTNVIERAGEFSDVEKAKDALEDYNTNILEPIAHCSPVTAPPRIRDKIKYAMWFLFGITGCFLSYRYMSLYINTFFLGGFIAFKCRYFIEMITTESYKKNRFLLNKNKFPDNEDTIIQTLKALYHMDPRFMLYKGWMNQFLYEYRPETYRLSLTISVYSRLKGSVLIMSYPYYKVPKRSLYNQTKPKLVFIKECMYDLSRCKVGLLPNNLVNKRKWSKKYPICIDLNSDSLIGVRRSVKSKRFITDSDEWFLKDYTTRSEQAEKLYKEMFEGEVIDVKDDYDLNDESFYTESEKRVVKAEVDSKKEHRNSEPEPSTSKGPEKLENLEENDVDNGLKTDSDKIYLFARNDPEKELWYHRLNLAASINIPNDEMRKKLEQRFKLHKAYLAYIHRAHELSNIPIKIDSSKNKTKLHNIQLNDIPGEQLYLWLNILIGRVCFDYLQNPKVLEMVADKFQRKLNAIRLPKVMDMIVIRSLCFGKGEIPTVRRASKPWIDHRGIWFELEIVYNGSFQASVDTKLNLMKLKKEETQQQKEEMRKAVYDSNQEDSGETSNDEGQVREDVNFAQRLFEQQALNEPPPLQGSRISRFVENMSSSLFELKYVKRVLENVAKKELTLVIDVKQLIGTLIVNLPPPPTDRIWVSFRGCPQITFEAKPKVNDTNVPLIDFLTKWLHNVLIKEFEKIIVLPNMTDFSIPMMNSEY
ncbi:testis-expressed protein 2 [Adelges cooleyi]|uniref:testis-expressed protein 2 n=1 Tax=Adelges cooleyi TaxID=133065 RepID=UPI00217F3BB8|nr:testis-expressed protein 2 [Adelges cooleyi]